MERTRGLGVREYPIERLAALEERSAKVLAELGVTAPVAPRREEDGTLKVVVILRP